MNILKTLLHLGGAILVSNSLIANAAVISDLSESRKAPAIIEKVLPEYPTHFERAGVKGYAVIEGLLNTQGRLVDFDIVETSNIEFAEASIAALRYWKFAVEQDGSEYQSIRIPMEFTLNAEPQHFGGELEPIQG